MFHFTVYSLPITWASVYSWVCSPWGRRVRHRWATELNWTEEPGPCTQMQAHCMLVSSSPCYRTPLCSHLSAFQQPQLYVVLHIGRAEGLLKVLKWHLIDFFPLCLIICSLFVQVPDELSTAIPPKHHLLSPNS